MSVDSASHALADGAVNDSVFLTTQRNMRLRLLVYLCVCLRVMHGSYVKGQGQIQQILTTLHT